MNVNYSKWDSHHAQPRSVFLNCWIWSESNLFLLSFLLIVCLFFLKKTYETDLWHREKRGQDLLKEVGVKVTGSL